MHSAAGEIDLSSTMLVRRVLALQEAGVRDLVDIKPTYHFKVTWPFWTRFILKPTVGMELWPSISAWTTMTMLKVARSSGCGRRRNYVAACCAIRAMVDILNSEFAALDAVSQVHPVVEASGW